MRPRCQMESSVMRRKLPTKQADRVARAIRVRVLAAVASAPGSKDAHVVVEQGGGADLVGQAPTRHSR